MATGGIIYAIFFEEIFYLMLYGGVIFLCLFGLEKLTKEVK